MYLALDKRYETIYLNIIYLNGRESMASKRMFGGSSKTPTCRSDWGTGKCRKRSPSGRGSATEQRDPSATRRVALKTTSVSPRTPAAMPPTLDSRWAMNTNCLLFLARPTWKTIPQYCVDRTKFATVSQKYKSSLT